MDPIGTGLTSVSFKNFQTFCQVDVGERTRNGTRPGGPRIDELKPNLEIVFIHTWVQSKCYYAQAKTQPIWV